MVDLFAAELHAVLSLQVSCQRFNRARSRLQCSVLDVDGAVVGAAFHPLVGLTSATRDTHSKSRLSHSSVCSVGALHVP